ncbi:2'-5' RNA ligase family protein [Embleya sp. MST-111070]|uniref:2'-5' RNA ligase family protein n=1 Tax=Embleya sp. MST-111070 TaxID=3398231 RepID=UPI003F73C55C
METFFTKQKIWPGGPCPHFLILFDRHPEFGEYVRAHHELLAEYGDKLGVIPERWLHSTIQGIHHRVTDEQMEQLRNATREEVRGMRPFTVQLGPTWPGITAVTVAMYPETGMAELNKRVRAATNAVPGISLRPEEVKFWAHSTICYARQDFDDRRLNRALRALRPERVDITIDRVHLVNQRQDPAAGTYTWTVVEEFPFAAT